MKTVRAIDAIKAGGFLMAEYDEVSGELKYRCVPGGGRDHKAGGAAYPRLGAEAERGRAIPRDGSADVEAVT